MNKKEIIRVLKRNGFADNEIVEKIGGIEILAQERLPIFEFDYQEFVGMFEGKLDKKKIHFLDNWTFTIECS